MRNMMKSYWSPLGSGDFQAGNRWPSPWSSETSGDWPGRLFENMDRFFDDILRSQSGSRIPAFPALVYDEGRLEPACELTESKDHFLMSMDLPGLKKEDVHVEVNENVLTISGERRKEFTGTEKIAGPPGEAADEKTGGKNRIHRYERSYGTFRRSFTLPATIDLEHIEAHHEDGVLRLYLPKAASAKARKIEIRSGTEREGFFSKLLGEGKGPKT